jgi:restriction endonuclease S subunit
LKAVAPLVRREIEIEPNSTYTELGVRSFNKGTFHRRTVTGAEFTWQGLYRIHKDDLIFSNIMAWEGAVAMAKPEDDNCIGNHRMLSCSCDPTQVVPAYLAHYFTTSEGMNKLVAASTGTVARNRTLTATALGKIEVPVPPLALQERIVTRLDILAEKVRQVAENLDAIEADAEWLLAVRFREATAGAPYRPMAEVAPLVRREILIDPEANYTELGVRSFYRGTFQRRTMVGTDYSWQALYQVKSGDLIFSNIMAWEQAIAIAKPEDNDCVGNHRMLTCLADAGSAVPGFLWYYFTTPEGFAKIEAASPGTAARNKTLTAPALMAIKVPVPSLATQQTFDTLQAKVADLKASHRAIREANAALVPATLERVFQSGDSGHG